MKIINSVIKMPKDKTYKQIPNDNGLNIRLFGASKLVGFIIITKELTHDYKGYMGTITHEEFKAGVLKTLRPEGSTYVC